MQRAARGVSLSNAMIKNRTRLALSLALLLAHCGNVTPAGAPSSSAEVSATLRSPLGSVPPPRLASAPAASSGSAPAAAPASAFGEAVRALSEPDGPFFSDNTISNETSYLQVAGSLARNATPGGAYLGVGPEQNFTYIALTRPKVAFIVDIRRQNMVLHLLYKAIFTEAQGRSHFLSLLLGRPYDAATAPAADASIAEVIAHATKSPPEDAGFAAIHARLRDRVERDFHLDAEDKKTLEVVHRTFYKGQLAIRFELHPPSGRKYPTLQELLVQTDPEGRARGFLASDDAFRFVQQMEKDGRIIPLVGDFAGDRAMPGIAAYLKKEGLTVSAFYVSNVEQYLFEPGIWPKWARNIAALPSDDKSLFIRAYLDQGRRHPQQMKGHRAATVLQRIADFNERQAKKPFTSFWMAATEKVLGEDGSAL
jgi:hypothetical protein